MFLCHWKINKTKKQLFHR